MIAKSIDVQYQSQGKPILTIKDAIAAGSFYPNPGAAELNVGNVTGEFRPGTSSFKVGQPYHLMGR